MKTLKIGIASLREMKARTMAIASGAYRPSSADPKLWFTSLEGLAKVLSQPNRRLLDLIVRKEPSSMTELANLSGRAVSNLSRTIATMEHYGLVRTQKDKTGRTRIHVPYRSVAVWISIESSVASNARRARSDRVARPTRRLSFEDAVEIWRAWHRREFPSRIAARFDLNPARVYEVIHEELHPGSKAVAERSLHRPITRRPGRHARPSTGASPSSH